MPSWSEFPRRSGSSRPMRSSLFTKCRANFGRLEGRSHRISNWDTALKSEHKIQSKPVSCSIEAFGDAAMLRQQRAVYRCARALGEGRFISNQGWTLVAALEELTRLPVLHKLLTICGTLFLTCEKSSVPAIRDS